MRILITGTAGFIGFHTAERLLKDGHTVVGFDSINDYYDPSLKMARLKAGGIEAANAPAYTKIASTKYSSSSFYKGELENKAELERIFKEEGIEAVVNLAAQAGVRYSLINPEVYIRSNINGFGNILECCRLCNIKHLVYASSSSVYGLNDSIPFKTSDYTDHPVSLYAASKKSNELMAHVYSHLFNLPATGLRFFTVYGPWGRPDMALFLFTDAIIKGKPVHVYNEGKMLRDFTYIDDITDGIVRAVNTMPQKNALWKQSDSDNSSSSAPYKVYNIGNNKPVNLLDFIEAIEQELGIPARKEFLPLQPGDVLTTFADIDDIKRDLGYHPKTSIKEGIKKFIDWYKEYYKI
ncbi:NAD-dependent epimerase [Parafilimonas sp.]|uniref:NAD-dependent epimerase n=1 Tax=Parafilimonas sp. TaxID=1969739 RepID=UPI0039E6A308